METRASEWSLTQDSHPDFDLFYSANRDRLYRAVALVVRDSLRARDAVDEAMARAWEQWARIGTYRQPEAWVYRVAVNFAISLYRKRRREAVLIADELFQTEPGPDFELSDAINQLSHDHRAVIVARFFLDWSVEETAFALRVSEGTVKSRTSRALEKLNHELR